MRINSYNDMNMYSTLFSSLNSLQRNSSQTNPLNSLYEMYPMYSNANNMFSNIFSFYNQSPSDLLDSASQLQNVAHDLYESSSRFVFGSEESVYNQLTADTDVEWANVTSLSDAQADTYNVEVTQLAQAQVNEGNILTEDSMNFETGLQSFRLETTEGNFDISFGVYSFDTNESVLERMANEINNATNVLSASVIQGEDGNISLQIESLETGESSSFEFFDLTGTLVETSGIENVSQEASNTIYEIDGIRMESETNLLETQQGFNLEVFDVGTFQVTIESDSMQVTQEVENLISELNSFMRVFNENQGDFSSFVTSSISGIENMTEVLSSIGIDFDGNSFQVTDRFYELASDPENVESSIRPVLDNFVTQVNELSRNISQSPVYSLTSFSTGNIVDYGFLGNDQQGYLGLMGLMNQGSLMDILFGSSSNFFG